MVKRKLRDAAWSTTDRAMTNEVLCKFLAHNPCVLIHEQHELGIEPVFYRDEPVAAAADSPAIPPMLR